MANDNKPKNIESGGNIIDDSFFDSLSEIDDGLGNVSFQKLNEDNIQDILTDSDLNLNFEKPQPKERKETKPELKLTSKALPTAKIPQKKEIDMMNKKDPLNLPDDDPSASQMKEIWEHMNTPDASEFKLMVLRLEPQTIKGMKISGYLETFHLPTTIPDIIEQIGQKYGGGKYQIRIVDGGGKYIKSKVFEISGLPKIPAPDQNPSNNSSSTVAAATPPVAAAAVETTVSSTSTTSKQAKDEDDGDDSDSWDDDTDFDYEPPRRRPLRPLGHSYPQYPGNYPAPSYPTNEPYPPSRTIYRRDEPKDNKEVKEVEEKVSKLENKLDKLVDAVQTQNQLQNQHQSTEKTKGLFDPDVVRALAPVVVSWLDSKGTKEAASVGQYSEMNKQIVGLMQGMQDLVRIGDKSKEGFAENERRERESSRKEVLDYQHQMEQRFLEQQRRAEERHATMLLQMKESLESKHREAIEGEQRMRLEYEKLRQDFREKEERTREESRSREEKLREESRVRDEELRRRENESREKIRQDEMKWREEIRQREEDARRRELEWKEELRQKEISGINESKLRELEMLKQMREMDQHKTEMQQKLLEQVYSNNNSSRESQLQMELAVAKMTSDSEARMLQSNAEMQLEKIRHATQMQMAKMKQDLNLIENKRSEDPIDTAMQDYLKRKLQFDMVKELNMEIDEDDIPSGSFGSVIKKALSENLPTILSVLFGGGGGGGLMGKGMPNMPNPGRVVNPTASPPPASPSRPVTEEVDEGVDEEDDVEADVESDEETETQNQQPQPDLSGIDPMQEIPRISAFFEYVKKSIEDNSATPAQAAAVAKEQLSPPIVQFLSSVQDSKIIIDQLYPLLTSVMGPETAGFFQNESTIKWMDQMLIVMAEPQKDVKDEKEVKVEKVETKSEAKPEAKDEKKSEESAPNKSKRGRKKKNVQQPT